MRGIGDPRAIAALANLPQRGLRGCTIVAPSFFRRSSFSGAGERAGGGAGRGGIGSAQPNDGAGVGRGVPADVSEAQHESNVSADGKISGRFAEWSSGAQIRVSPSSLQQQSRGGGDGGDAAGGQGRGAPLHPQRQQEQDVAREEESSSFGRGRGMFSVPRGDAGRGSRIPPTLPALRSGGSVGRGIPLGAAADVPHLASSDETTSRRRRGLGQNENGKEQGGDLDELLPSATEEPKRSAVEELLSKLGSQSPPQVPKTLESPAPAVEPKLPFRMPLSNLGSQSAPQVSVNVGSPAPVVEPKLPFRMPFARPAPPSEQQQQQQPSSAAPSEEQQQQQQPSSAAPIKPIFQAQPSAPFGAWGRGRGQPGAVAQPGIGAEPEAAQTPPRRVESMPERARRSRPRPPSPPRMQLSVEEARARALEILEKGIEKNVAAEGERRRKAGMEKFADATEFLTDRFNRPSGPSPSSQPQRSRNERQRPSGDSRRRDKPRRPRLDEEGMAVSESSEVTQLTPEQEAQLVRFQEEDTFKDRLHNLFLAQFEPEFAMEEFGRNPDIDEPPVLPLEEYLQGYKQFFLPEDAELSQEQKWQEAVKASLANAPDLEKLVEAYAGPGRMTARQQIEKLQTIRQKLPPTVSPEVSAFTQRAFLTLQNNPRLNMHQKEKLMTNIVSGFS